MNGPIEIAEFVCLVLLACVQALAVVVVMVRLIGSGAVLPSRRKSEKAKRAVEAERSDVGKVVP